MDKIVWLIMCCCALGSCMVYYDDPEEYDPFDYEYDFRRTCDENPCYFLCIDYSSKEAIAQFAECNINSTRWAKAGCLDDDEYCGQWKCNLFVAYVVTQAERSVPHRRQYWYSPIGAREWLNPHSTYLTEHPHWQHTTTPSRGDVAASGGHVGIVTSYNATTGHGTTVSAAEFRVVHNDWGFRPNRDITVFWTWVDNPN